MIKIFNQSNSKDLTNKLIKCNPDNYILGKLHKTVFANGELTVVLEESVRNQTIVIVSQPDNYNDIFELFSTIDAAKRSSAKEIIGIIPSLPHSRQERRVDGIRTSISARLFADLIQSAGLDRIITMDVHTTAIEGFYNIPFDNITSNDVFMPLLKQMTSNNPIAVSPDFGGMKRTKKFAKDLGLDMVVINKERLKANQISDMELIGNVTDRDLIIFDDMIDTGGTLLKAAKLLKDNNAQKISVFATHGIFSNNSITKMDDCSEIDTVFVTNTVSGLSNTYTNILVIDISTSLNSALQKIINL